MTCDEVQGYITSITSDHHNYALSYGDRDFLGILQKQVDLKKPIDINQVIRLKILHSKVYGE